ncbi:MAG: hypothetical protein OIF56_05810 [Cohaesibacter sp.]|nr:hypothetical protein [Cohaesibacter sp.]MCV6602436.1 hypothetical protein [Cohaesibacter sp.]
MTQAVKIMHEGEINFRINRVKQPIGGKLFNIAGLSPYHWATERSATIDQEPSLKARSLPAI